MKVNKKTKIILLCIILVVILTGTVFATIFRNNSEVANSEVVEEANKNIPNVNLDNTNFDISETELTDENVIIKISSQLENYNLYYSIDTIEETESEGQAEQENQVVQEEPKEKEIQEENYLLYQDSIEIEANANIYFKYELEGKYSDNPYVLEISNINKEVMTEELENEGATEEELQKGKVTNINNEAKYYIIVNYVANVVTIYGKDSNNEYTIPVKAMVCSTGVATPRSGVYKLTTTRYRWRALFGGVYGQYAVKIVGNILFHSVPYLATDNGTLEYWEYDKLGTSASAGCVRLTTADALWIYNNCESGTQVEFSSNSSNPLGKPTAQKISGYENLRGYDPTDLASNNPWRNVNISANANVNVNNQNNSNADTSNNDNSNKNPDSENNNSTSNPNIDTSESDKNDSDKETSEENTSSSNKPNESDGENIENNMESNTEKIT